MAENPDNAPGGCPVDDWMLETTAKRVPARSTHQSLASAKPPPQRRRGERQDVWLESLPGFRWNTDPPAGSRGHRLAIHDQESRPLVPYRGRGNLPIANDVPSNPSTPSGTADSDSQSSLASHGTGGPAILNEEHAGIDGEVLMEELPGISNAEMGKTEEEVAKMSEADPTQDMVKTEAGKKAKDEAGTDGEVPMEELPGIAEKTDEEMAKMSKADPTQDMAKTEAEDGRSDAQPSENIEVVYLQIHLSISLSFGGNTHQRYM